MAGNADKDLATHLKKSKEYYSLNNLDKARASLISARIIASSRYVTPTVQAEVMLNLFIQFYTYFLVGHAIRHSLCGQ
jgi:hypothetical protein